MEKNIEKGFENLFRSKNGVEVTWEEVEKYGLMEEGAFSFEDVMDDYAVRETEEYKNTVCLED